MKRPQKKGYESLAKILRIANLCGKDKGLAANYGEMIARACAEGQGALRWWPNVQEASEWILSRVRRGEWWSTIYDHWPSKLLDGAKADRAWFIIAGEWVPEVPLAEAVDRDAMKMIYQKIVDRQKIEKMKRDA
jgi:hypothetical protein